MWTRYFRVSIGFNPIGGRLCSPCAAAGGVSGAILTAIVGLIKSAMPGPNRVLASIMRVVPCGWLAFERVLTLRENAFCFPMLGDVTL